jgi:hypothetical protein
MGKLQDWIEKRDEAHRNREPLDEEELADRSRAGRQPDAIKPIAALDLLAWQGLGEAAMTRTLVRLYDSHGWFEDTVPGPSALERAVRLALRRRQLTGINRAVVSAVVRKIRQRAIDRGSSKKNGDKRWWEQE